MRDPRRRTLVIEQGVSNELPFRLTNRQTGAVIDIPGAGYVAALLQVRTAPLSEGGDLLLELSTDNGGVVLGPYDDGTGTMWSGYLYIGVAAASDLTPWGEGVYDLLATHESGTVAKMAYGPAELVPVVSEVS
jgi:hypothetical protein